MTHAWFVTGTDTEIGKTFVSCALLHAARARGLRAIGMKPVAAGCDRDGKNDDVEALAAASSEALDHRRINPYLLKAPIAPHIAASEEGVRIDPAVIVSAYRELAAMADVVIVEGVGGFRVPFDDRQDSADLAVALGLPVILVVGLRLGCINHALLSVEAIAARGLRLAGWVANRIDPDMLRAEENLAALQVRIPAPLLGSIPFLANASPLSAAACLHLPDGELVA